MVYDMREIEALDNTGFTNKEISQLIDSVSRGGADEEFDVAKAVEEALAPGHVPRARIGDIYQMGPHRVMCGDSTDPEHVSQLMDGSIADMVWTDPPYNVDYESQNESLGSIMNDKMTDGDFQSFMDSVVLNLHTFSRDGAVFYLCCGWQSFAATQTAIANARMHISEVIIWVKNRSGIRTLEYPHKHEQIVKAKKEAESRKKKAKAIFYGWKEGDHYAREKYNMDYDVWEEDLKASQKYVHPTEKPDWLVMKAIKNSSRVQETVLDLFTGSGSALVAAEKTGRHFRGMELDPRFVDVIVDRWHALTGQPVDMVQRLDDPAAAGEAA
jgi:DNA modification methylase